MEYLVKHKVLLLLEVLFFFLLLQRKYE